MWSTHLCFHLRGLRDAPQCTGGRLRVDNNAIFVLDYYAPRLMPLNLLLHTC
jgi:hypothetical protein